MLLADVAVAATVTTLPWKLRFPMAFGVEPKIERSTLNVQCSSIDCNFEIIVEIVLYSKCHGNCQLNDIIIIVIDYSTERCSRLSALSSAYSILLDAITMRFNPKHNFNREHPLVDRFCFSSHLYLSWPYTIFLYFQMNTCYDFLFIVHCSLFNHNE